MNKMEYLVRGFKMVIGTMVGSWELDEECAECLHKWQSYLSERVDSRGIIIKYECMNCKADTIAIQFADGTRTIIPGKEPPF